MQSSATGTAGDILQWVPASHTSITQSNQDMVAYKKMRGVQQEGHSGPDGTQPNADSNGGRADVAEGAEGAGFVWSPSWVDAGGHLRPEVVEVGNAI